MKKLSLCSGIGGMDLAAKMAGIETDAFCEIEKYPVEVLKLRFPGKKIINDVREVDGREFRGVDVISGGFPCQPFSVAGKRKGAFDTRHLFPELARIVAEAQPEWFVGENVRGLFSIRNELGVKGGVLGDCITRLSTLGYAVGWCCYGAVDVGAPHKRDRIFIIANKNPEKVKKVIEKVRGSLRPWQGDCWPTPVSSDGTVGSIISKDDKFIKLPSGRLRKINRNGTDGSLGLARMITLMDKLWQTPTSSQRVGIRKDFTKPLNIQEAEAGGNIDFVTYKNGYILTKAKLNPDWVALLMGFPVGWASLGECEDYFRGWPAGCGPCQYEYEPPRLIDSCDNLAKQLIGYGNAVNPYQGLPVFEAIKEVSGNAE